MPLAQADLDIICNVIRGGRCMVFLGAGASTTFRTASGSEVSGLPSGGELAMTLAGLCDYDNRPGHNGHVGPPYDLAQVADYFVYRNAGRDPLESAVRNCIQIRCVPRPIHTVLAQLSSIRLAITTNYDLLFEEELNRYGRRMNRHVYNPTNPKTGHFEGPLLDELRDREVVLHKMHGTIEEPNSLVIGQSEYIAYLANLNDRDRGMPEYFRKMMMPRLPLLFLGYGLSDWNFQVIWQCIAAARENRPAPDSFAFVRHADPYQIRYWAKRSVQIFEHDLSDLAVELAGRFNLEIPQLEITRRNDPPPGPGGV